MKKLSIVEFKVYTDGDIGIDDSFFRNYISHYFDNELYEYTYHEKDSYSYSLRRVFDTKEAAISFVNTLFESMWGDTFFLEETAPRIKNDIIADFYVNDFGSDFTDGNIEMKLTMKVIKTTAKKIKRIIYED